MHPKTRRLLLSYSKNGLYSTKMGELIKLMALHAPFLMELITHSNTEIFPQKIHQCHPKLYKLLQCVTSTSPVCALVPPNESVSDLLYYVTMTCLQMLM